MTLPKPRELPFAGWWPIGVGAAVGVLLRFVFFGKPGSPYAAMTASFIFLAPLLVGAMTVYLAERRERRTWGYYVWASFTANMFFVLGTFLVMLEGLICAIVVVPMFAVIGIVGGLIMGAVCRVTGYSTHALYGIGFLPLVFGGLEGHVATPSRFGDVERTAVIHATPEVVWRQIMDARDIRDDEMGRAWAFRIGAPQPRAAVEETSAQGAVRKIRLARDVHFDQVAIERRENEYVRWRYRLYPDSFPPYALDDHVLIGGYYFDVNDTSYTLASTPEGTLLRVRISYRVTTQFNWYTDPLARLLLGNLEDVLLDFYRARSEGQSSSRTRPTMASVAGSTTAISPSAR